MHLDAAVVLSLTFLTAVASASVEYATPSVSDASDNTTTNFYPSEFWRRAAVGSICADGVAGISDQCQKDLQFYCESLGKSVPETWAMKMFDSSTKATDGVLWGHLVHLGNFDECLNVQAVEGSDGELFDGQHCLVAFSKNDDTRWSSLNLSFSWMDYLLSKLEDPEATLQVSWCIPSSCSAEDLVYLANAGVEESYLRAEVAANECHTYKRPALRDIDFAAIAVLCFFILLAIASTAYDVQTMQTGRRRLPVLLSFSLASNWQKLIAVTSGDQKIYCINGILALSVAWVVLGNTLVFYSTQVPSVNAFYIKDYVRDLKRMGIVNTYVAIDTLLLISGLLVGYLFLKEIWRTEKFNFGMFYCYRYLRMTLPLGVVVLFTASLLNHAGTGPLWDSRHDDVRRNCESNWWLTLLYVNNYVNIHNRCLTQSWYLSVEMQLFWLSPLVLVLLWKREVLAKVWIGALFLAGLAATFCIVYFMKIDAGSRVLSDEERDKSMKYYQLSTYTRFPVWLVGILLGCILHQERKSKRRRLPLIAAAAGWAVAVLLMVASVYLQYPFQRNNYRYDALEAAFYLTLHRPAWALGVAWVIYACDRGHGGIINAILSSNVFQPLSRLSYGIYLTHVAVINLFGGSAQAPIYLSDFTTIHTFLGVLIMSLAWAIPLKLLIEAPIIALKKAMTDETEKEIVADLPPPLRTPIFFKKPSMMQRLPDMIQINDSAEGPDPEEVMDVRL